ncbi:hypothetical protein WMY93_034000 [Mugilogobius chulae]|uniref:Uncharacterized protein n=1 Tax=Mugilogobius chulae TaxID=88201 RepID=A0AAW0MQZ4_9GOBI
MQCVELLRKRTLDLEPWDRCKTKRVCLGAELVTDCPMETCDSSNVTNQLQLQPHAQLKPGLAPGSGLGWVLDWVWVLVWVWVRSCASAASEENLATSTTSWAFSQSQDSSF